MRALRLSPFMIVLACGSDDRAPADASTEADVAHGEICEPDVWPWICIDSTHWATLTYVQCPSSRCPAECTSGAKSVPGDAQACDPGLVCNAIVAPQDAGSPCVSVVVDATTD